MTRSSIATTKTAIGQMNRPPGENSALFGALAALICLKQGKRPD
jgi:hypothetical protein